MSEDLKEFLHRHGIKNLSPAFQKLMEYGVTEVAEISLLTEKDLLKAGRYCAVKILPADCIILKISQIVLCKLNSAICSGTHVVPCYFLA